MSCIIVLNFAVTSDRRGSLPASLSSSSDFFFSFSSAEEPSPGESPQLRARVKQVSLQRRVRGGAVSPPLVNQGDGDRLASLRFISPQLTRFPPRGIVFDSYRLCRCFVLIVIVRLFLVEACLRWST